MSNVELLEKEIEDLPQVDRVTYHWESENELVVGVVLRTNDSGTYEAAVTIVNEFATENLQEFGVDLKIVDMDHADIVLQYA